MSIYVRKFTTGSRPTQQWRQSPHTDSYAKKFVTNDSVENNAVTDSTNNAEHINQLASGMKVLSLGASTLAQQARAEIAAQMSGVFNVDGVQDPLTRKPTVQFNEEDVNSVQAKMINAAGAYYSNVSDPTIRDQILRQIGNHVYNSRHAFIPIRMEDMTVNTTNLVIPQIESAEVDIAKNKGATDNFYIGLMFNVPVSSSDTIRLIRIFRAEVNDPIYTRQLPVISSNGMQRLQSFRGSKSQDQAAVTALRMNEMGVPNAVSLLNYVNPFTGQRVSAVGTGELLIPPKLPNQKSNPNLDIDHLPDALSHLDASVAGNINVIYNLQNNPILGINLSVQTGSMVVGAGRAAGTFSPIIIDRGNKLEFKEVGQFTPGGLSPRRVGNLTEYYFEDSTVSYGGGYKYFVVTVNDKATQSARSAVVDAVVEGLRVPPRPLNVVTLIDDRSITLTMTSTDQLVEKFEIYRRDENPNAAQRAIAQTISDQEGYTVSAALRDIGSNRFLLIGECFNSMRSGGSFMDGSTIPGRPYTYRVYAVDIFGNKSESPFEIDAYIPDFNQQYIALKSPSLLAEVDANTHKMKLTFACVDPLVERLTLERRDVSTGEETFSVPQAPSRIIFGYGRSPIKNRASMSGERLFNQSQVDIWTGVFVNQGQQIFVDKTVQYDHIYQYRVYGEDRYGNKTSYVVTSPLMIVRHPFVNAPVSLETQVAVDGNGFLQGVQVSWKAGTLDVSAGDQLGSQVSLADTAVRTLYQVQRRHEGEDRWLDFSLTSGSMFIDPLNQGAPAPNFRPPYVEMNQAYHYRVQAIQTGSFISNFTQPSTVFVGYDVAAPDNFVLRNPAATTRPFYVMLNWDTRQNSGVVDRWQIERCAINNIAAAQLNTKNPAAFAALQYNTFRTVYRESSRFSGKSTDQLPGLINNVILVGSNYYMDTAVDFGNTYIYRIRAISPEGRISPWSYRGIKVTSATFEQKYQPLISEIDKTNLVASQQALTMFQSEKIGASSYSMLPGYARPSSMSVHTPRWFARHNTVGDDE